MEIIRVVQNIQPTKKIANLYRIDNDFDYTSCEL